MGEDVADKLSQALGVDTDTERTIEFVDVDSEEGKKVLETMAAENKKINKQRPVMPLQHCVGVYCIFSAPSKNYYIGYTNKILIRIRIHNGELSKKLSLGEETLDPKKRPWILLFFIYGFPNCDSAQKLE